MRNRTQAALVFTVVVGVLTLDASAVADEGDDTLRSYLARSDLVVLGEIASEPGEFQKESGVANYVCDFRVTEVLKGTKPAGDSLTVNIRRFEMDEADRLPELKKGSKCILFLKRAEGGETPAWKTADFWFGFQRPSPWMARSLKRLAEQEAVSPKR
jgi:hypothetical protein